MIDLMILLGGGVWMQDAVMMLATAVQCAQICGGVKVNR